MRAAQPGAPEQPRPLAPTAAPVDLAPHRAARAVVSDPGPAVPSPLDLPARRPEREPRSELIPDGDGTYRAEDAVFTARIGRDGRVRIEDKPNLRVGLKPPRLADVAEHLEAWAEDPYGTATRDERAVETHTFTFLTGSFDLTDAAMRAAGLDPYLRRKALFLDRTRELRARMAEAERTRVLRASLDELPAYLAKLWNAPGSTPAERRRILFRLWDDCAERGPDEVVRAGRSARATVLAFIRRVLPAGSEHAYSGEEIRALDAARRSAQHFAPYPPPRQGPPPAPGSGPETP